MSSKWNSQDILRFLNIYEHYEALWNTQHSDYNSKNKRDRVMKELMKELLEKNIIVENIDSLRRKIKIIKNVYRQELVKMEKSKSSGKVDEIYNPKLIWFKRADAFLGNVISARSSTSNLDLSAEESVKNIDQQDESEETEVIRTAVKKRKLTPEKIAMHVRKSTENRLRMVESAISKLQDIAQSCPIEDEYDSFAKHIAMQMRQLPVHSYVMLQEKIQSLITIERLRNMESPVAAYIASPFEENNVSSNESFEGQALEHNYHSSYHKN